jgi:pimeloyl-ACP methyl ester carboxylesterase
MIDRHFRFVPLSSQWSRKLDHTVEVTEMDIVLVPGMWLDASSWEQVVPHLEAAGHHVRALTLPGMDSKDADRSSITLTDHVDAVVEAIDAATGPVVLVGHSAGSDLVWAATDRRPDRVARVIMVGGSPSRDGDPLVSGYEAIDGEIPLPDWSTFDDADLDGLDDAARDAFRARAIPSPAGPLAGPQRLNDPRRLDVPVTSVCTEYRTTELREWIYSGDERTSEAASIRDLTFVDLPTGHWPQFTRPADLAALILAQAPLDGD